MKKTNVDFNPDDLLRQMPKDFSQYMEDRLSTKQLEQATTLIYNDPEMKRIADEKLQNAFYYWEKLQPFRQRRKKCRDFYQGDHWKDTMTNPDTGETITMEDYIRSQNMVPIKQNMIRQHIKNLLGQFIENDFKSIVVARNREDQKLSEMMSKTLEAALQLNKTHMLDVSVIEEFFISGAFGWKTHYGWHEDKNRDDLIIDSVHPALMFFNTGIKDIRLKEIDFIGEIHDVPIEQVISTFAKNEADRQIIKQWYGHDRRKNRRTAYTSQNQDSSMIDNMDFYTPYDVNMCRVVEIWEKVNMKVMIVYDPIHGKAFQSDMSFEELEEINRQRFEQAIMQGVPEENIPLLDFEERYENIWHFWFLTDRGDILMHGETPYEHEQSPYTLGLYPLVDGNIWGFAYDILDQQIQINRLLTAMDKIVGTSSKGALLLPTQARADGWTNEDYASEMTKSDGVIEYNADPKNNGIKPEELNAKNINIGAIELLQMQMNLLEQISGVTNAIQGQKAGSGTPLGIYQLQTSNAQINNRIYFEFFFQRRSERDLKAVKVIQQYYTEDRNIQITGKDFDDEIKYYEAAKGRDLDIMISMGRATNTPVMRQVQDDILLRFLDQQLIDLDIFTELTSLPFADKLRETINRKQQELEQAQQQAAAQGLPTEADPEAMAALQSAIGMKNGKIPGLQVN
ncbi:MAG: hypothetical protein CL554_07955 [Algoriphagus sp.]|uniref:portal protein n=2 Tax=Algoriphagus sp. TaxID=1872435 RepID=UPI000C581CCB|nr:hypothetical protein [Algoriphagus sp.]MAL13349.1 hypothetical protein [Algoriphagus sp.]MAN85583.1 hypothetical protein [Algoriphagus sp.]HAD52115.1 hypothetical protein [Algoriphagus sp.]|tara:strand:+ start:6025 stop:8070 length:2046 start_codon:yes stop_codon:yes gene_type:complete